jgi:peptidyl-tRNA hydrolase
MDLSDYKTNEFGRVEMNQVILVRKDLLDFMPRGKILVLVAHFSNFSSALQIQNNFDPSWHKEWFRCPHKIILAVDNQDQLIQYTELSLERKLFCIDISYANKDTDNYDMNYEQISPNYIRVKKYSAKGQSWKTIPDEAFGTFGACVGPIPVELSRKLFAKLKLFDICDGLN